jgi:hypothetical protein
MKSILVLAAVIILASFTVVNDEHHANVARTSIDTTPKKDTQFLALVGTSDDFKYLIGVLNHPEPAHKDIVYLTEWIRKNVRFVSNDSTSTKTTNERNSKRGKQ